MANHSRPSGKGKALLWGIWLGLVLVFSDGGTNTEATLSGTPRIDVSTLQDSLPRQVDPIPIPPEIAAPAKARIQESYGRLPMHFEPNRGQAADEVQFLARGPGYTVFLTTDESVLVLPPPRKNDRSSDPRRRHGPPIPEREPATSVERKDAQTTPGAVIRTRLEGPTRAAQPVLEGLDPLPGTSNYFLGNDPDKWRTGVPQYRRVRYPEIYPGIDLVYYGNPQRLEHDFIVAPGADPGQIQLAISGAESATVNADGDLVLRVPGRELVQQAPKIYQVIDGQQQSVAGRYVLRDAVLDTAPTVIAAAAEPASQELLIGFELAQYDQVQPLIIDPVLVYSSYLGGNETGFFGDRGGEIAVDSLGNAYVTGATSSPDFPKVNSRYPNLWGQEDAFIVKLSGNGQQVIYSTYLGGSGDSEQGLDIALDISGNAYITGFTESANFPKVNALYPSLRGTFDAFIFKLSANGQTVFYSTYLGGSHSDVGTSIAVDGNGNAYVTGETLSADFPIVNALYPNLWGWSDAFIFKLSTNGQTVFYSTYLGGSGSEIGYGIGVDSNGNAYVTGVTDSADFPTNNAIYQSLRGSRDVFVFKLSAYGQQVIYSTYFGGSGQDGFDSYGAGAHHLLAVDSAGNAYIVGTTFSSDFPTVNALYPHLRGNSDAFIFKLSDNGQNVIYSTYLGGSGYEQGEGVAVDNNGNAYVTGVTGSSDFPIINFLDQSLVGGNDAFVCKLSADGRQEIFSTYLRGSSDDYGLGIAVDGAGNIYIIGFTRSIDFPIVNALYPSRWGELDVFIAKIADVGDGGGGSGGEISPTLTLEVLNGQEFRQGAGISADPYSLGNLSITRSMIGLAADGEARLVLRVRTNQPGPVTFTIPTGDGQLYDYRFQDVSGGNTITVDTLPVNDGYMAFAIYRAPQQFPRVGHSEDETQGTREVILTVQTNIGTLSRLLILTRPPLVLLHGLWSNGASWDQFQANVHDRIAGTLPMLAYDYETNNGARLATNHAVPGAAVSQARKNYRDRGIASVKADFFGHSMGGILGRIWAQDSQYKSERTYGAGDFHKLITIDSPHGGSVLACLLWDLQLQGHLDDLGEALLGVPLTDQNIGALEDLCTGSGPLTTMNGKLTTGVPAHVIVGNYVPTVDDLAQIACAVNTVAEEPHVSAFCNAWKLLKFVGVDTRISTHFPVGGDLVVGVDSQRDGLSAGSEQVSERNHIHFAMADYPSARNTAEVADRVVELLNAAPTDSLFGDGFPIAGARKAIVSRGNITARYAVTASGAGLQILAPTDGSTVAPGQLVSVVLAPESGVTLASALLVSLGDVQERSSGPWEFTIAIPETAVGPMLISAVGKDNTGTLYPTSVTVDVVPIPPLSAVSVLPANVFLDDVGLTVLLAVSGIYQDDSTRNLTSSWLGTSYQTSDPDVVTVDTEGIVTAQGNGSATITVTNGSISAYVAVRVEADADLAITQTDNPDPIGPDGRVTYTLTVENKGPARALDLQLFNQLPTGAIYLGGVGTGWSCAEAGGSVHCLKNALEPSTSSSLDLQVQVARPCGLVTNQATVQASTQDPFVDDNLTSAVASCPVAVAPTVVTNAATSLTPTGATLAGQVNDNGANTTTSFEYGSTIDYGSTSAATPATVTAGSGATLISAAVTGLTCNSTYHYRAKGVNSAGTGYGSDLSFTTLACPVSYDLTVALDSSGQGSVTSDDNPQTIHCPTDCTDTYVSGTVVTLTATADTSSSFVGWSGACSGTGTCQVTLNAAKSVTATFSRITYALNVAMAGSGQGSVASDDTPSTIICGLDCSETYPSGTVVNLTATATTGSTFVGWSGACSGTGSCQVTLDAAKSVTATFHLAVVNERLLQVAVWGTGQGRVTSSENPLTIDCGADCSESYPADTGVTLWAVPESGSRFVGWSGACEGTSASCLVRMHADTQVAAWFDTAAASQCGREWHWVNPLPQGNPLTGTAYGNGRFVAVGWRGTILSSADGATWTLRSSGTTQDLNSLVWNGSQFVALTRGLVLTSADGETWLTHTTGPWASFSSLAWNGSQFVGVGYGGAIWTSSNGVDWTAQSSGTTAWLQGVTWGSNQFVVVGHDGTLLTSANGETWTVRSSGTTEALHGVSWNGSRFVVVGENGVVLTSDTGVNWAVQLAAAPDGLQGVAFDGQQFVAVGWNGTVLTSADGLTWATATNAAENLTAVAWVGNQFVAVGLAGALLTSADGTTWIERRSGNTAYFGGVAAAVNQVLAVSWSYGTNGGIYGSTDGLNWTERYSSGYWFGVTWSGSRFVAVGWNGSILTSPDGVAWTTQSSGTTATLYEVTWSGSQAVAVGDAGALLTSPDGVTWTTRTSGTTESLNGVVWGGSQWVAVGGNGTLLTSPTGENWSLQTAPVSNVLEAVAWNGSLSVAVGTGGAVLSSPNGIDWTARDSGTSFDLSAIIWTGNEFVAAGDQVLLTSADGATWVASSPNFSSLSGLTRFGNRVFAVGRYGTVLVSDCSAGTAPNAPSAMTLAATGVTSQGATLNGTVNANGADATVSFEYGSTTSYSSSLGATPGTVGASAGNTGVSASLSGLTCNSTYHYRVTASNSAGTSQGLDETFTTAACPVTAPTATTSAATSVTATAATLNGTLTPNGADTTASFDYGPTTSYGSSLAATPGSIGGSAGSTAIAASLTGLTCNSTYHYRARGLNSVGTGLGGDQSFTTGACSSTCTPGAILMNTPTTLSGLYSLSSAQSITTSASVQVQTGADVTFAAPSIRLGPGFRVALGAKFRAEAHAVTCP